MKSRKFLKAAGIAVTASMVLSVTAGAANLGNSNQASVSGANILSHRLGQETTNSDQAMDKGRGQGRFGFGKLVADGTLTQDQADAISNSAKTAREDGEQPDLDTILAALVEDGTLTQDQSDTISSALPNGFAAPQEHGQGRFGFGKLVEDGTLTQDQADTISDAIKTAREDGEQPDLDTILATLVEDGTLTQDQADAISSALPNGFAAPQNHGQSESE